MCHITKTCLGGGRKCFSVRELLWYPILWLARVGGRKLGREGIYDNLFSKMYEGRVWPVVQGVIAFGQKKGGGRKKSPGIYKVMFIYNMRFK